MPEQFAQPRLDRLAHRLAFQVLACAFEIRTDSDELAESLKYLVQQAEQAYPVRERHAFAVLRDDARYVIVENGAESGFELASAAAFDTLFKRVHAIAFEALPDHIRLHAASGFLGDRFFVVAGEKYAGKSTLALALLQAGVDMVGDELVMLCRDEAVSFPRKMYVREDSVTLVPEFRDVARGLPFVSNPAEPRMVAFDPLVVGRPWRIRPAPIAAMVFLDPVHSGRSRLVPCGKLDMVRRIMTQCTPPISGGPGWVGALTSAVDRARTFTLELGDLETAVVDLRRAVA